MSTLQLPVQVKTLSSKISLIVQTSLVLRPAVLSIATRQTSTVFSSALRATSFERGFHDT